MNVQSELTSVASTKPSDTSSPQDPFYFFLLQLISLEVTIALTSNTRE